MGFDRMAKGVPEVQGRSQTRLALILPNTQQIMRHTVPGMHLHTGRAEDELQPAPRLADKLAWRNTTGWAIGIGLLAAIAVLAMTRISEFLYFQF